MEAVLSRAKEALRPIYSTPGHSSASIAGFPVKAEKETRAAFTSIPITSAGWEFLWNEYTEFCILFQSSSEFFKKIQLDFSLTAA